MRDVAALFVTKRRTDDSYVRHDETWWDFLDRVDDLVFDRVRRVLNDWFAYLPAGKSERFRQDFQSRRDVQVEAAFTELLLHAAFRRTPLSVELEPGRDEGRQPDFACESPRTSEGRFLVEARLVGDPPSTRAREKRLKRAFDDLNQASPPGFSIMVSIDVEGRRQPAGAELRRKVIPWLETLDYEAARSALESQSGRHNLPEHKFIVGDWVFKMRAVATPRDAGERRRPHRLIAVEPFALAPAGP